MLSVIYVSSAVRPCTKAELVSLLQTSHDNNSRWEITGMLLYQGGSFLQHLEGPDQAVRNLYRNILADPRHHKIQTLIERPTGQREFPDWTMGFYDLRDPDVQALPGYSPFLNTPIGGNEFRNDPSLARRLFGVFRHSMSA